MRKVKSRATTLTTLLTFAIVLTLAGPAEAAESDRTTDQSAPEIVLTPGLTSNITNAKEYLPCNNGTIDTTHFLYPGMNPAPAGPLSPKSAGVSNNSLTSSYNPGWTFVEAIVDSSEVELILYGNAQQYRVVINGVEAINTGPDTLDGRAEGGGTKTITLGVGAASTNGAYNTQYIFITSGAGSGQSNVISSYSGNTRVATVANNWTVRPDSTSTFRITAYNAPFAAPPPDGLPYSMLFTFDGKRAERTFRIETDNYFSGIRVDASGSVRRAGPTTRPRLWLLGDSFGEGTGADCVSHSFGAYLAATFGWELWDISSGGTGIVNSGQPGSGRFSYLDRVLPPINAWIINIWGVTAPSSFTLSQGPISTGPISTDSDYASVQSALDTAFGVGSWSVGGHPYYGYVIIGRGANATVTVPLIVTPIGVTGTIAVQHYIGDIAPFLPTDAFGTPVPFYIFVEGTGGDDNFLDQLPSAATALYSGLAARFPTARIIATGRWMNQGPETPIARATNSALQEASRVLAMINGQSPFVNLFNSSTGIGYLNGSTDIGNPSGQPGVNTDIYVSYDGTHPTTAGHLYLAKTIAGYLCIVVGCLQNPGTSRIRLQGTSSLTPAEH